MAAYSKDDIVTGARDIIDYELNFDVDDDWDADKWLRQRNWVQQLCWHDQGLVEISFKRALAKPVGCAFCFA